MAISWSWRATARAPRPIGPKISSPERSRHGPGPPQRGGNRITLLREADGDGKPELRTVFIDHLHSPLWNRARGRHALRRQYRRDPRLQLCAGRDADHGAGREAHRPSGRPDRSSLDEVDDRERRRFEALRRGGFEQQHHRKWHGRRGGPCRHLRGRPADRRETHLRFRHPQPDQREPSSPRRTRCSP